MAVVAAFWLLNHLGDNSGHSDVRKIRISDLAELLAPTITADVWQSDNEQADPPLPYTSDSCPIVAFVGVIEIDVSTPCCAEDACGCGSTRCCGTGPALPEGKTGPTNDPVQNSWSGIAPGEPNGQAYAPATAPLPNAENFY